MFAYWFGASHARAAPHRDGKRFPKTAVLEYGVSGAVHLRSCPDGADSLNGPNWSVSDKIWLA